MRPNLPTDSTTNTGISVTQRSAVTNGSQLFLDGDGRGRHARRFRDLVEGIEADLGGPGNMTMAERSLVRKAAALDVWSEDRVTEIGKGDPVDLEAFTGALNTLRRLYQSVGLKRRARDATPDLDDYVDATTEEVAP